MTDNGHSRRLKCRLNGPHSPRFDPDSLSSGNVPAVPSLAGKGEATLPLPVVATGSLPRIYHDASFSHGRPPPNCLQGGASLNILSLPAVGHSDRAHQSDECDGSGF
jgi:hypothetical protein